MHETIVLATDMDGTFIPLVGNLQNLNDLSTLASEIRSGNIELVYVTGRDHQLVLDVIESDGLPKPEWMICDVGTTIYKRTTDGYRLTREYANHLRQIVDRVPISSLQQHFSNIHELLLQEDKKQSEFKLSYYCDADLIEITGSQIRDRIASIDAPYNMILSIDPFTGDGLIDLLPTDVSKAYALRWWVHHTGRDESSILFAGDSGNDLAALTEGYRSIIVGNGDPSVIHKTRTAHAEKGWNDRLFIASRPATSGVLEGLRHFKTKSRLNGA